SLDTSSIRNTKVFLENMRGRGYGDDRVKLVINYPYSVNGVPTGEVTKALNYPIFWKVPHDSVCSESVLTGHSFIKAKPQAKISQNVLQLARTLSGVGSQKTGILHGLFKK
ncbi:MAG TPA: hypothetical protein VJA25_05955, partial [Dehalococcoidia bacterium]|nr:hypothetical protein [Dehalococcoidia bacterium]